MKYQPSSSKSKKSFLRDSRHKTYTYPNESTLFLAIHPSVFQELKKQDKALMKKLKQEKDAKRKRNKYASDDMTNDDLQPDSEDKINKEIQEDLAKKESLLKRRSALNNYTEHSAVERILFQRTMSIIQNRYDLDFHINPKKVKELNLVREVENGRDLDLKELDFTLYCNTFLDANVKTKCLVNYTKPNTAISRHVSVIKVKNSHIDKWRDRYLSKRLRKRSLLPHPKEIALPSDKQLEIMNDHFRTNAKHLISRSKKFIDTLYTLIGAKIMIEEHENPLLIGFGGIVVYSTYNGCYLAVSSIGRMDDSIENLKQSQYKSLKYIPWVENMKMKVIFDKKGESKEWLVYGHWMRDFWEKIRMINMNV